MGETLLHTYTPLVVWTTIGAVLLRVLPDRVPRLLGRALFWVGVPLEIFALARHADLSVTVTIVPVALIATVGLNLGASWLVWSLLQCRSARDTTGDTTGHTPGDPDLSRDKRNDTDAIIEPTIIEPNTAEPNTSEPTSNRRRQGSFVLASLLSNTGFVGLAVLPLLVPEEHLGAAIVYSVSNNLFVTYGIGVSIASYFGRSQGMRLGWQQIRDVLTVPSLWAFALGVSTRRWLLPDRLELGLDASIWVVIPAAFVLMGMRMSQLQNWDDIKAAIVPSLLKLIAMPLTMGLGLTAIGVTGDLRLALVLMAGMPTAFAGLILVEEYGIEARLMTSCILLSTVGLLVTLPVWLALFG